MRITPIARTVVVNFPVESEGTEFRQRAEGDLAENEFADIDTLAEIAGRACYKSWGLPNPDTSTNEGYTENVLDHRHFSVFEHGSVSFWVEGVSRALLLELERHRHVSFSVESQRYVNTRRYHTAPVFPPLWAELGDRGVVHQQALQRHYEASLDLYDAAYHDARDAGISIKEAREAARAFLLESTPVDLLVTGNIRAWRDVLEKRFSTHADKEIQAFSKEILSQLKTLAPNSMQDISDEPND